MSDPISGARIVFQKTGSDVLELELRAPPRWSAGPTHVHPKQEERIEVQAGTLASRVAGHERMHAPGEVVVVPAGTPHTIWNGGGEGLRLVVHFRPALRIAEAFETAFGLGRNRATATQPYELARLLVATRGYRDEFRLAVPDSMTDAVVGGAVAALAGGLPSTVRALFARRDPLESFRATGSLLLPREQRPYRLLLAAVPTHLALSVGWALPLAAFLPRRRTILVGAAAGLAIAAFDFGLVGRRFPRIRELPLLPQLADHTAYGAAVAAVVASRRTRRASARI